MNWVSNFARKVALALFVAAAVPGLAGVVSLATATQAGAVVAQTISVKGNQRIDASTIRTYLTIKVGQNYGSADLDASQKALFNTGLFSDVSVASVNGGSGILVTVVENPVINSVVFQGNSKIKADVLSTVTTLKARDVLTNAKLQDNVIRLRDYYSSEGRGSAVITPQVTSLPDNRVNVVFVINEGARVGVTQITFVGNNAFPTQRLLSVITTKKTNWLSWLNKRDIYTDDKLAADQNALRQFYLNRGYADFQVISATATQDDKGEYHVTYTLDEGPKYTFGGVAVDSSIPGIDPKALQGVVKTKAGSVFDADEVQTSVENLTVELSRLGYVFAQVRPRAERDYNNHVIPITYVIDEGPRAYIERIEIRGNTKTRDYVIRREFDIAEGDAYNRVLIDKAQRRLQNLGYFKTVDISTQQGSAPDKVVVVVTVEDQSTGSFSIAGGVSTTDGLIAEVSLQESNFLGRGQAVKISVSGGRTDRSYTFSFSDPYFLGYHVSAGFNAYRNLTKPTSFRPFTTTSTGGGVSFGLPLTDKLSTSVNYKLDTTETSGAGACSPAAVTGCYFPDGTRVTSTAGYGVAYSTIDSYTDPHQGVFLKLNQDFAGVGGDAHYLRTTGDARMYVPIGTKTDLVGLVRVQGGNVTGLNGQQVAISDNFFRGGETVRGFANLGYGPRDNTPGASGSGDALGGKNFAAATAELQFPLPLVPPDFGLKGAVFFDAGALWGLDVPPSCAAAPCVPIGANDTSIRTSVGGSIMWNSPFGPLRLDIAQALNKQNYDKTELIRFGAGASF
jgi:outer membrane protein insertion porin family